MHSIWLSAALLIISLSYPFTYPTTPAPPSSNVDFSTASSKFHSVIFSLGNIYSGDVYSRPRFWEGDKKPSAELASRAPSHKHTDHTHINTHSRALAAWTHKLVCIHLHIMILAQLLLVSNHVHTQMVCLLWFLILIKLWQRWLYICFYLSRRNPPKHFGGGFGTQTWLTLICHQCLSWCRKRNAHAQHQEAVPPSDPLPTCSRVICKHVKLLQGRPSEMWVNWAVDWEADVFLFQGKFASLYSPWLRLTHFHIFPGFPDPWKKIWSLVKACSVHNATVKRRP